MVKLKQPPLLTLIIPRGINGRTIMTSATNFDPSFIVPKVIAGESKMTSSTNFDQLLIIPQKVVGETEITSAVNFDISFFTLRQMDA